jgi:hypothetical protein
MVVNRIILMPEFVEGAGYLSGSIASPHRLIASRKILL